MRRWWAWGAWVVPTSSPPFIYLPSSPHKSCGLTRSALSPPPPHRLPNTRNITGCVMSLCGACHGAVHWLKGMVHLSLLSTHHAFASLHCAPKLTPWSVSQLHTAIVVLSVTSCTIECNTGDAGCSAPLQCTCFCERGVVPGCAPDWL